MTDTDVEAALFRDGGRNKAACRSAIDYAHVHHELHKSTATLHLLWSEYQEGVVVRGGGLQPYGYSQFCGLCGAWRVRIKPSMRRVHRAGEKAFIDYSGKKPRIFNQVTGEAREVELFVMVLGASNYTYSEATYTQKLPDFVGATIRGFEDFGGAPEVIVPEYVPRNIFVKPLPRRSAEVTHGPRQHRRSECTVVSKQNSPHIARDHESTITNSHSDRLPPPGTATLPTCAQSIWASSPISGSRRRNPSSFLTGRTPTTKRRSERGLPLKPRSRSMSKSRAARSRGYRRSVSVLKIDVRRNRVGRLLAGPSLAPLLLIQPRDLGLDFPRHRHARSPSISLSRRRSSNLPSPPSVRARRGW